MAIAEPNPEYGIYEPTEDDVVETAVDGPVDPSLIPDDDPNVSEPDADAVVVEGEVADIPADVDGFLPGNTSEEVDLPQGPIYLEVDPNALEIEDPNPDADDDEGDIYDASTFDPDDDEWAAVPDGTAPAAMALAAASSVDADLSEGDFVVEPLTASLEDADDERDTPIQYEIQGRSDVAEWVTLATVPASEVTAELRGLPTEENWIFRIRAIFSNGDFGEWSAETNVDLPRDMIAPPTPATPTITGKRGVVTITSTGLGVGGEEMPPDYQHTVVWQSATGEVGTWNAVGLIFGAGQLMVTDIEYYTPMHFALSNRDLVGNESSRSAVVSVVLRPLVEEPDIKAELDRIDEATGGLVTESREIIERLDGAVKELEESGTRLTAAEADLKGLTDTVLPELDGRVDKLQNADLPAITDRLASAEAETSATRTELTGRLEVAEKAATDAEAGMVDLRDKQLPALGRRLDAAETELSSARQELGGRLASAESSLSGAQQAIDQLDEDVAFASRTAAVEGLYVTGVGTIHEAVIEKLWADVVNARKITTDMLLVGGGGNELVDPRFEDAEMRAERARRMGAGWYFEQVSTGEWSAVHVGTGSASSFTVTNGGDGRVTVTPGVKYVLTVDALGTYDTFYSVLYSNGLSGSPGQFISANDAGGRNVRSFEVDFTDYRTASGERAVAVVPVIRHRDTDTGTLRVYSVRLAPMVDGSLVVNGSISGRHIEAKSISSEVAKVIDLDVSRLVASGATISSAVVDKLWADVVSARKIYASQILVGQGENLVPYDLAATPADWSNIEPYGATGPDQVTQFIGGGVADGNHLYRAAETDPGVDTITWRIGRRPWLSPNGSSGFAVEPGEELKASVHVKAGGSYATYPDVRLGIYFYTVSGNLISSTLSPATTITWSWYRHEVSAKAPATAAYALLYLRQNQPGGIRVDMPSLYRKKDGGLIVSGSITGDHLEVNSVAAKVADVIELNASRINSGTINTARLNTDSIAAATASIQRVDIGNIFASSAKVSEAVIEKLWTDVLHARKITADMLILGAGANVIPNASLATSDGWDGWGRNTNNGPGGTPSIWLQGRVNRGSSSFAVEAGKQYHFEVLALGQYSGSRIYIQLNTNGTSNPYLVSNEQLPTGTGNWKAFSSTVTIPSGATEAYLNIYGNHPNGTSTNGYQWFTGWGLYMMSGGEMIVDGAISTKQLAANAVEAGNIKANAITADKINAGSVTAIKLASSAVTADKVAAKAITGDKIAANTITAGNIAANAITANELAANAVTATNLKADAITGKTITGGKINGAEIVGGSVTMESGGYAVKMVKDAWGGAIGMTVPKSTVNGTLRAEVESEDSSTIGAAQLVLRSPASAEFPARGYIKVNSWRGDGNELDQPSVTLYGDVYLPQHCTLSGGGRINLLGGRGAMLTVDDTVRSATVYNRTYSGAANMYITSYGTFGRATSALKYKTNVEVVDPNSYEDALLGIQPKSWHDKAEMKLRAEYEAWQQEHPYEPLPKEQAELLTRDPERHHGAVADDFHEAGLTQFVQYDANGEVDALNYDRVGVALLPIVRKQRDRITALEDKVEAQADQLAKLLARVEALEASQ